MGGRQAADNEEEVGVLRPQLLAALGVAQGEQEQMREADLGWELP